MYATRVQLTDILSRFGPARIIRITPDHVRRPRPLYFHGGYGVDSTSYMHYIAAVHGCDTFTVSYTMPRPRDDFYWLFFGGDARRVHRQIVRRDAARLEAAVVAEGQSWLARDMVVAADTMDFPVFDAIGQSAGAMRVLEFARQAPTRLGDVVLPFPAGVIKPDRRQLLRNGWDFARSARVRYPPQTTIYDVLGYRPAPVVAHPRDMVTTGDNVLLSYHAIRDADWWRGRKYRTVVLAGASDTLFTPARLCAHVDAATVVRVVPGRHGFAGRSQVVDTAVVALGVADT